MEKIQDIENLIQESGICENTMTGYKEGRYILQVFGASEPSWFYVLIYRDNDELIGVSTFITDGEQTMVKIKFARNLKLVERLTNKLIKIKESDYVFRN